MYEKHTRRQVFGLFVLLGSVTLVACWKQSQPQHMSDQATSAASDPAPALSEDSWEALLGVQLRSVQKYPGGLGEDGVVLEHMRLTLNQDRSFEWIKSDISIGGTYRREGKRIFARGVGRDFTGELDLERGILIWNGTIEFKLPSEEDPSAR